MRKNIGLSHKAKKKLTDYRTERGFKAMMRNYENYVQCTLPLSANFQTFTSEKPELDLTDLE